MRHKKTSSFRRRVILTAFAVIIGVGSVTGILPNSSQTVGAISADEYCKNQTVALRLAACKDGIIGTTPCSDYEIVGDTDPEAIKICQASAAAKAKDPTLGVATTTTTDSALTNEQQVYKNYIQASCAPFRNDTAAALWCLYGGLGKDGTEGKPKTIADCLSKAEIKNSNKNQTACIAGANAGQTYMSEKNGTTPNNNAANSGYNRNSILDQLDQSTDLSEYIDILHQTGQDKNVDTSKEPDDNPEYYINGAGKKQPIKVYPSGKENSPAIIFLNGGGWHANDHNSDRVMAGENGAQSPKERGYTALDVSYRYGSSGVYYQYEDVMRGIQHVINNADIYGIDPSKIVVWGDSAGGSLAMRAVSSGKSGAKVGVGWSPPTNAYTGLFRSYKSLMIGMDHSTCIPTDLAGLANVTDLLNGGSGEVAEYGQGLSSNSFDIFGGTFGNSGIGFNADSIGGGGALDVITQVLTAGQYAVQSSQNVESISSKLENGGIGGLGAGTIINLSAKKLNECLDNFNALSPALFASPETPPSFLAGFNTDDVVGPEQVTGMRDKLLGMGIRSEAMLLDGDPNGGTAAFGPNPGNHLDYDMRFVCPTMNFIDSIIQPDRGNTDCKTGVAENAGATPGGGGSPNSATSPGDSSNNGSNVNNSNQDSKAGNINNGAPNNADPCANIDTSTKGGKDDKRSCVQKNCIPNATRDGCIGATSPSGPTTQIAPSKPVCNSPSIYDEGSKSCVYYTAYKEYGQNQWGASHGCGDARFITKNNLGNSVCGVGSNAKF